VDAVVSGIKSGINLLECKNIISQFDEQILVNKFQSICDLVALLGQ
jgi:hypothetical protein